MLEHRWYLSERAGFDVPLPEAIADYVRTVLPAKPDERAVLGVGPTVLPVLADETEDEPTGIESDSRSDSRSGAGSG